MQVIYSKTQVNLAAEFIVKHNQFISTTESVLYKKIKKAIKQEAKLLAKTKRNTGMRTWCCFGATLVFFKEKNCIDVYVTVDPAVSVQPQEYKHYKVRGL